MNRHNYTFEEIARAINKVFDNIPAKPVGVEEELDYLADFVVDVLPQKEVKAFLNKP